MLKKSNLLVTTGLAVSLIIASNSWGQNVGKVVVEGNRRVETPTVLSLINIKPGKPLTEDEREDNLQKLYGSGLFSDVVILQNGDMVTIKVTENQIINSINYEGNDRIKDELLNSELGIKPREVYTPARVQEAAQKIRDMYRITGRYAAKVEPKIVEREEGRVDLVFEIQEGKPTRVNRIIFIGNDRFSDSQLEKVIMTKESRWYRIFTIDDSYDPNRLAYDQELMRKYYLKNGYADFRVKSVVAELDPNEEDFVITFTIDEGQRYQLGQISVENNMRKLNSEGLGQVLELDSGEWYNNLEVDKASERLVDAVIDRGHPFVDIEVKPHLNPSNATIDLKFVLKDGKRQYINRIEIIGNDRTNDEVIRREFRFVEGDPLNKIKLKRSEQRLKNLGYFRKVEIKKEDDASPDKVNIKVNVEDQPTGSMRFAAGWSTSDGAIGSISLQERNLMGKGLILNGSAMAAFNGDAMDFRAGIADPYFLGRRLLVGIEGFHTQKRYDTRRARGGGFKNKSTGGTTSMGYELTEHLLQDWSYTLRYDEIGDFRKGISPFIRRQRGDWLVSAVGHDLFYDKRDNSIDPTEGYYAGLGNQVAGVGGNVRYSKNGVSIGQYIPIDDDHKFVWSNKASGGVLFKLDKDIRVVDRYTLGGESLRGFDSSGLGPRDISTRDALGGQYYYKGSSEFTFPIGLPNELGVRGSTFIDIGSVWHSGDSGPTVKSNGHDTRVGVGAGVYWKSPLGPVGVTFAKAVRKKSLDRTRVIMVNFGTNF